MRAINYNMSIQHVLALYGKTKAFFNRSGFGGWHNWLTNSGLIGKRIQSGGDRWLGCPSPKPIREAHFLPTLASDEGPDASASPNILNRVSWAGLPQSGVTI